MKSAALDNLELDLGAPDADERRCALCAESMPVNQPDLKTGLCWIRKARWRNTDAVGCPEFKTTLSYAPMYTNPDRPPIVVESR